VSNPAEASGLKATIRCRPWTHGGMETVRVLVDPDDTVWVHDEVAGHYTVCHALSPQTQRRIARRVHTIVRQEREMPNP